MIKLDKKLVFCLGIIFAFLPGCQKYYLSLTDQNVDVKSLASTYVGSPDKRQHTPPIGQLIVMDWRIPQNVVSDMPYIELYVLYGNYTEKKFIFPLHKRMGYKVYKNLNEEFIENKGILTYRADIKLADGQIYKSWTHQLWVNLISIEEDDFESEYKEIAVDIEPEFDSLN